MASYTPAVDGGAQGGGAAAADLGSSWCELGCFSKVKRPSPNRIHPNLNSKRRRRSKKRTKVKQDISIQGVLQLPLSCNATLALDPRPRLFHFHSRAAGIF